MTQQHPIIPPPELVKQWHDAWFETDRELSKPAYIANCAAQWGYEQHEKALLDAMHAVVPQPYEPEVDEHGYPLKLGDFYAS